MMESRAEEYKLTVEKTARYYILPPDGKHRGDMLAIHGYRQLGKYFVRNFEALAKQGIRVIVPEGLHRFYIEGYSGRVGASWMTKEDRISDIEDYVKYLEQLYRTLGLGEKPLHLLGFSQGGPTACRWLSSHAHPIASLILHSTVFPNDFDFEAQRDRLHAIPTYAVFGDDDMFASEETITEKMAWMRSKGIEPELLRFKGKHEIHLPSIEAILEKIQPSS